MVPLKIQLLAAILFISEAYSQIAGCSGSPQKWGPATPSFIPGGQFIVPAMIMPRLPAGQPAAPAQPSPCTPKKQAAASYSPASCAEDDDDSDLDKLLYLLISNIIESKKGSGKKQTSTSYDNNAGSNTDSYDPCACSYGDDYDYCTYSTPVVYSPGANGGGCDSACPEISVYIRPFAE